MRVLFATSRLNYTLSCSRGLCHSAPRKSPSGHSDQPVTLSDSPVTMDHSGESYGYGSSHEPTNLIGITSNNRRESSLANDGGTGRGHPGELTPPPAAPWQVEIQLRELSNQVPQEVTFAGDSKGDVRCRVLLVGMDDLLGRQVLQVLTQQPWQVRGISGSRGGIQVAPGLQEVVEAELLQFQPQLVLHLGAADDLQNWAERTRSIARCGCGWGG